MNASVDSVFPEKYRILSGSALKMIAVITMLIDHIGAVLLSMYQPAQKNPVYTFRQRIYCISYFPRYRKSCFSHLLFSPAGRLPSYTEPVPLWKKSPSFCAALRNSVESDVYKYAALRKTKCVFYAFPRISGLLCH